MYFGSYTVKHFVVSVRALKNQYGWSEYIPQVNHPRDDAATMERNMRWEFGRAPDVILFLQDYNIIDRKQYPRTFLNETLYMCWYDDTPRGRVSDLQALVDVNLMLPTYEYLLARAPALSHVPRLWMPHSALPSYELPFNPAPREVVLLVGHVEEGYPLRNMVRQRIDGGDKRFEQLPHSAWQPGPSMAHNDEFAAVLNSRLAAICDGSRNNFAVAKVFEIPMTGALLLFSDDLSDALEALGFLDHANYVSFNASSLDATVDWVLNPKNRARVDLVRAAGQALAHARHKTNARVGAIHEAALELFRSKRDGVAPNLAKVARFRNYNDWSRKDPRSAEYYADRAIYARARLLEAQEYVPNMVDF